MALDGVEIFANSSGSHHELRKLRTRIDLIKEATLKAGTVLSSLVRSRLTCSTRSPAVCTCTRTSKAVTETASTTTAAPSSPSTAG